MNSAHIIRNLLPAFLIILGLGALGAVLAASPTPSKVNLSANPVTPAPAPTPQPSAVPETRITVDGHRVPVKANGSASVSLPSGKTIVESSGGQTTVTTTSPTAGSVNAVIDEDNLNVSVHSSSSGDNSRSRSRTNVTGRSDSTTWSSSSTTTTSRGTGQATVEINR